MDTKKLLPPNSIQPVDGAYSFFEPLPELPAVRPALRPVLGCRGAAVEPLRFLRRPARAGRGSVPGAPGRFAYGLDGSACPAPSAPVRPLAQSARSSWAARGCRLRCVGRRPRSCHRQRGAGNRRGVGTAASIRVSVEKVDQMINLVGELVITQAMLTRRRAASIRWCSSA